MLQAIKDWRWEWPGNEDRGIAWTHNAKMFLKKINIKLCAFIATYVLFIFEHFVI